MNTNNNQNGENKMNKLIIIASFLLALNANAGGGHFHPKKVAKCSGSCTEEKIKDALPEAISHLNKWGKIDLAWAQAKIEGVAQKQFKKGPEWVLTLVNNEKQKQYVFMTLDGFVTGANATGE